MTRLLPLQAQSGSPGRETEPARIADALAKSDRPILPALRLRKAMQRSGDSLHRHNLSHLVVANNDCLQLIGTPGH